MLLAPDIDRLLERAGPAVAEYIEDLAAREAWPLDLHPAVSAKIRMLSEAASKDGFDPRDLLADPIELTAAAARLSIVRCFLLLNQLGPQLPAYLAWLNQQHHQPGSKLCVEQATVLARIEQLARRQMLAAVLTSMAARPYPGADDH